MKVAANTAKILRNVPLPDEVSTTYTNGVVLDMGSYNTRLGFAGDNAPRMNERTVVVKGGEAPNVDGQRVPTATFNDAYRQVGKAEVTSVIYQGNVVDWQAYEMLMQRVDGIVQFNNPESQTPLLVTEKALVPASQRQRMAEILFEKHGVQQLNFSLSPVLALYAAGLSTGISVEMGHEQCHVVPVFQGFSLFHANHCLNFGGNDLTDYLTTCSKVQLPSSLSPHQANEVWRFLKEKYVCTAESSAAFAMMNEEGNRDKNTLEHYLPDGNVIELGPERYEPCELFFSPTMVPKMQNLPDQSTVTNEVQLRTWSEPRGIPELIVGAARKCDRDLFPYFMDNILLSGGSSLFRGLPKRVESEVQKLLPAAAEPARVVANVERQHAAFVGGSILASLPSFQDLWVPKSEYEEQGSICVVRGCM